MKSITKIIIPIFFFIQYFGIGAPAQILIILLFLIEIFRGKKIQISLVDTLLIFSVLFLFIIKLFSIGLANNLLLLRFYWGFTIFYFYFKLVHYKINLLLFFWMAVIITIVDFVLINTVIPFEMMRNIPARHIVSIAYESKFLSFIRCYGLASNPAASSTIIVALLAGLYTQQRTDFKDYHILVSILPLICLGSGTGFLLYLFFVFVRYKLYMFNKLKFILGIISILVFYFILTKHYIQKGLLDRLDINYFERLLHLKTEQITNVYKLLNHSLFETIFGFNYTKTMTMRVASDFGWVDLMECYGFFGVSLFVLYLIFKKRFTYLPILIFVLGYFHYTAIGSIPGQILFATLLLFKRCDKNELEIP